MGWGAIQYATCCCYWPKCTNFGRWSMRVMKLISQVQLPAGRTAVDLVMDTFDSIVTLGDGLINVFCYNPISLDRFAIWFPKSIKTYPGHCTYISYSNNTNRWWNSLWRGQQSRSSSPRIAEAPHCSHSGVFLTSMYRTSPNSKKIP